jgi:putative PIN family toxin of toxin-antitoxin system
MADTFIGTMNDSSPMRVVLDTNVLVAAARSRQGASFALVSSIPAPEFIPCLSIGLYAEWQAVLTRAENIPDGLTADDALGFVRYLANQSHLQEIHFLWRPFLPDPDDDMVLELAVSAGCQHIITHNVRDYRGSETFGITPITPGEFLDLIRKRT